MAKLSLSLWRSCISVALLLACNSALAQNARFDLEGPKVEVRVTRAGRTLPIAYVPNLQEGDKLWLHPDLPPTQSVHYLLIAAFLRGTTNPPPDEWFFKIETWNRKVREEGVSVTVPKEAQQAILFLAPETGGDFATLRKAVRGRPGVFVRASQDLAEAGFEQARIEKYVASMREVPPGDAKALAEHSLLLSRTLNLRPNEDCFKRSIDLQYNCLTQAGNQTLLDDGHAQSVIAMLSNGPNSDFITAASYTGLAGGGTYSAYVGAAVDLFRILGGLHTAQYQYIPAISFPTQASLNLRLNTAPSFRNPKSVIVIGLPSIQAAIPPPLRPTDPNLVACLLKPKVVLPVEGAPLVFSTSFAHDLTLHVNLSDKNAPDKAGVSQRRDIALVPDAFQGGFVVDPNPERKPLPVSTDPAASATQPALPVSTAITTPAESSAGTITGTISGSWGFDAFKGPTLRLQTVPGSNWHLAADDPLIAGRENHVLLASSGSACVDSIGLENRPGSFTPAKWKPADHANVVDLTLPLKSTDPGSLQIVIKQFGDQPASVVTAKTFAEPATLTAVEYHAGDTFVTATGTHLGEVKQITVGTLNFAPVPAASSESESTSASTSTSNSLRLSLPAATPAPKLKAGDTLNASFTLKDGRTVVLPVIVAPSRPVITLLNRNMGHPTDATLHLGSEDDLPSNQQITFSLKSSNPFPRAAKIEVANADESLHTPLTVAAGSLVLQNPHTILATFDPLKTFGTSAFGPLRIRAVMPEGTAGDWLPLATLVRLPTLSNIRCSADTAAPCTLTGSDLYLLDSVATDQAFSSPTPVPEGFVGSTLSITRPAGLPSALSTSRPVAATIYLHLRDDLSPANSATIPVLPTTPTSNDPPQAARHKDRDVQPRLNVSVSKP